MPTIRRATVIVVLASAIFATGSAVRASHYHFGYHNGQYGYHYHDHGDYDDHDDEEITPDYYGAIAYSRRDGKWGYSYNFSEQNRANSAALQYCTNAGGQNCSIVLRVRNGCGALAAGPNGWASETGGSRAEAEYAAKQACASYSRRCTVRVWVCTSR